jgi:hypothetical protein
MYYSPEHVETLLLRARADGVSPGKIMGTAIAFYGSVIYEGVHPLESGFLRFKFRKDRRPTLPVENPWFFYPRYVGNMIWKHWNVAHLAIRYALLRRRIESATTFEYRDLAITPVRDENPGEFELYKIISAADLVTSRSSTLVSGPTA